MASLELHWLPLHPALRPALQAARAAVAADPVTALGDISRLAMYRLDYLASLQLARLLDVADSRAWPEIRLALLGSTTMDHLLAPIRVAGARRRLRITPFLGDFGQYRQEIFFTDSKLRRFAPTVVLIVLRVGDVIGNLPLAASRAEVDDAVAAAVAALVEMWRVARADMGASVIQQTFLNTEAPVFGNLDGSVAAAPAAIAERLNARLREAAAEEGVMLLDLAAWAAVQGRDAWFDPVCWHHAKQLIALPAAVFYGDLVARLLAAQRGLSAKCLVLDLDNTLWGGVIGDDGLDGIVLGQGSAAGEAFLAFQNYAKLLSQRGVILAVCSKNTHAVAEAVFLEHPDMVLKRTDIAAFVANWEDKPSNLREIARQLNIGVDSLVFFDDNPAEREIVRQNLPEVAVPEAPEDPAHYIACLADGGYFEAIAFTADDAVRGAQYRANAERAQLAQGSTNIEAFLSSLDMRMTVSPFTAVDLPRIAQLTNKSNQFNLTTKRYTQDDLAAYAADPAAVTLSFRLIDKFGDNGLICVMVALPDATPPTTLAIDTWLMSCRVLGRQVEEEVVHQLWQIARARGFATIAGTYIPTAKNGLVRDLYERMGFTREGGIETTRWSLSVADYTPVHTSIAVDARPQLQHAENLRP